jgi:hypothetical protein
MPPFKSNQNVIFRLSKMNAVVLRFFGDVLHLIKQRQKVSYEAYLDPCTGAGIYEFWLQV